MDCKSAYELLQHNIFKNFSDEHICKKRNIKATFQL